MRRAALALALTLATVCAAAGPGDVAPQPVPSGAPEIWDMLAPPYGRITLARPDRVEGWVVDPADVAHHVKVSLLADGRSIGGAVADRAAAGPQGRGHAFALEKLDLDAGARVALIATRKDGRDVYVGVATVAEPRAPATAPFTPYLRRLLRPRKAGGHADR